MQYLRSQETEVTGDSLGIRLRETNRIHAKVRLKIRLIDYYVVCA